jgi:hypothetical protein
MVNALDLLHKYASTFRKMIQARVLGGKASVKHLLKLNSDGDFDFLIAAMDIIDDASAAIAHVERFGLSGATKYDDFGERYLRLYGLLSATYIQQQSMLTVYRLINCLNPKKMKMELERLQIRKLRHKLSAHGTDYLNTETGHKEAYVPLRFDLGDRKVTAVRHSQPMEHEKVDVSDAIEAHLRYVIEMMDSIIAKANKTFFKGQEKRQKEFAEELDDLRTEKSGGLVLKGPKDGHKIVVTFVGSK